MNTENKQKSKKIFDIVSFSAVFLLFVCSLICLIARLNGARFDLFGNRYDVVLTNSMSFKNENHLDFLENDNNQFNAFDLAISKQLPAQDKLQPHDVVIYTDRYIGTNMHRIVDVQENYHEEILFSESSQTTINNEPAVQLNLLQSQILSNDIRFKTMSITTYTTLDEVDNFNFFVMDSTFEPIINKEQYKDGYKVTYKITRDTEAPGKIIISHSREYDYSKEYILNVRVDSLYSPISVNPSELIPTNLNNVLGKNYNTQYIYQIRGDAAKDDDGWYSYKELQALVVGNAKGMGYVIRFMGSVWGGLMFALLAILILVVDIVKDKLDKKEEIAAQEGKEMIDADKNAEFEKKQKKSIRDIFRKKK